MKPYERIKELREDNDKSQQAVANYLQIDRKTYCRYENNQHEIKIETLIKLARYYNVTMDYISGVTNEKRSLKTTKTIVLTEREKELIKKYNKNEHFQEAINKLLDIKKPLK